MQIITNILTSLDRLVKQGESSSVHPVDIDLVLDQRLCHTLLLTLKCKVKGKVTLAVNLI